MSANHRACSLRAKSPKIMEVVRAFSEQKGTIGALADPIVSEEEPAREKHSMRAERTVIVTQEMSRDAIAGICWLIEDAVTALVTLRGRNGVPIVDNPLQPMLQGLENEMIEEK